MAEYCSRCGRVLDVSSGLCPACDRERLNEIAEENIANSFNFCPFCGSDIDPQTGKCTNPLCGENKSKTRYETVYEEENSDNKSEILKVFITVGLSILFCITSFFAVMICVNNRNVQKSVVNAAISEFSDDITADLNDFCDYISRKHDIEVTEQNMKAFIENSEVKEFINGKVSDFCDYIVNDDAVLKVTKREITDLLRENKSALKEDFKFQFDDSAIDDTVNWIFDGDEIVITDSSEIKNASPIGYSMLVIFSSFVTMIVFVVLSLIILFFMVKNSFLQTLCGVGISLTIMGGISALIAVIAKWAQPMWNLICGESFVSAAIGDLMCENIISSLILFAAGIAILAMRTIIINVRRKGEIKKQKEIANEGKYMYFGQ